MPADSFGPRKAARRRYAGPFGKVHGSASTETLECLETFWQSPDQASPLSPDLVSPARFGSDARARDGDAPDGFRRGVVSSSTPASPADGSSAGSRSPHETPLPLRASPNRRCVRRGAPASAPG